MNDNIRELMSPAKLYTPEEEASKLKARFKLIIKAEINDLGAASSYGNLLPAARCSGGSLSLTAGPKNL